MTAEQLSEQLQHVCSVFRIPGQYQSFVTIVTGNINNTYKVCFLEDGVIHPYTVQSVNTYVFKTPEQIMKNIELINAHMAARTAYAPGDVRLEPLHYYTTVEGNCFARIEGGFWRVCGFLEHTVAYDTCSDPEILKAAGKAFGAFQSSLSDFDASLLEVTIPDFHNTRKRLNTFFDHVAADPCGRVTEAQGEIDYIASVRETACKLNCLLEQGDIPIRATHNDTKANNVLLDEVTSRPVAVIDLDTVMPGLSVHDFGDAVRFAANTAAEDEAELSKVSLDLELYRAFAEGFIQQTAQALTRTELDNMALGALTITIELAVRFLDDYLTGDKYFKCKYPEHNLVRARCQLALAQDMQRKYAKMDEIVQEVCARRA